MHIRLPAELKHELSLFKISTRFIHAKKDYYEVPENVTFIDNPKRSTRGFQLRLSKNGKAAYSEFISVAAKNAPTPSMAILQLSKSLISLTDHGIFIPKDRRCFARNAPPVTAIYIPSNDSYALQITLWSTRSCSEGVPHKVLTKRLGKKEMLNQKVVDDICHHFAKLWSWRLNYAKQFGNSALYKSNIPTNDELELLEPPKVITTIEIDTILHTKTTYFAIRQ